MTNKTDISLSPNCILSIEQALYSIGKNARPHIQKAIIDKIYELSTQLEAADKAFNTQFDRAETAEALITELEALNKQRFEWAKELGDIADKQKAELAALRGTTAPDAEIKWDGTDFTVQNVRDGFSYGCTPVFIHPAPPIVVLPCYGILESTTAKPLLDWQDGWNACLTECAKKLKAAGIPFKSADGEGE